MSYSVTLSVPAISCGRCVMKIERVTSELPGVLAVHADADARSATYLLESEGVLEQVKQTLAEIGFPVAMPVPLQQAATTSEIGVTGAN